MLYLIGPLVDPSEIKSQHIDRHFHRQVISHKGRETGSDTYLEVVYLLVCTRCLLACSRYGLTLL